MPERMSDIKLRRLRDNTIWLEIYVEAERAREAKKVLKSEHGYLQKRLNNCIKEIAALKKERFCQK